MFSTNTRTLSGRIINTKSFHVKPRSMRLVNLPKVRPTCMTMSMYKSKHVALSGIFFSNLMIYTLTRDLKDVIFITDVGAQYIPFVKSWLNFPLSLIFLRIYTYCSDMYSKSNTFKLMYVMTLGIIFILGCVLYPLQSQFITFNSNNMMIKHWVSTAYYVMSPIWGNIIVSMLFWTLANDYNTVDEAKRIYPLMGMVANVSLIAAGILTNISGMIFRTNWYDHVRCLSVVSLFFGCISLYMHNWMVTNNEVTTTKKNKMTKKIDNNMWKLLRDPFIVSMIVMISCYGACVGSYEVIWKHYLKDMFMLQSEYSNFMGRISMWKGMCTILFMAISSVITSILSWKYTAMITPITLSIFGVIFFVSVGYQQYHVIAISGAILSVFAKACKYAFFDPCKEIAYIPLSDDIKNKGKSFVEILSAPIGKTSTLIIMQILMIVCDNMQSVSMYIGCLYVVCSILWNKAVIKIANYRARSEINV